MGNKLINFKKKLLRLRQSCHIVVGVLSLAPCYVRKKQVRDKGLPLSYHHGKAVSSLVDDCQTMHPPPALILRLERERTEGRKREKFYIYLDDTHTLAQNSFCEFWCGMQRTCKNTNNKLTRRMRPNTIIYRRIITVDIDHVKQQR